MDPVAATILRQTGSAPEDDAWADQWSQVFTLLQAEGKEGRAQEYAAAVAQVKKETERLLRRRREVQNACEQLLHTAYREATQANIKCMLDKASERSTQDVVDAARRAVDELCPVSALPGKTPEPAYKARQDVVEQLSVGLPQPGVSLPAGLPVGLQSLPPKPRPAPRPEEPQQVPSVPPLGGQSGEIGAFAAAAAAAQQEAANLCNLEVTGLPEGIDEGMFKMLFSRYGTLQLVKLVGGRRAGFVKYSNKDEAQAAISALDGFECQGVKLGVKHVALPA